MPPLSDEDAGYMRKREIDSISYKIDKVESKVDAGLDKTTNAIEQLARLLEERWKAMELRFDASMKNQQQSIDGLQDQARRLDTLYTGVTTEQDLAKERARQIREELAEIKASRKWIAQAVTGSVITTLVALAFAAIKFF